MIPTLANLFRAGVLLVLVSHVFYMYSVGRTQQETFGFDLGATIIAGLFAGAMLIPLVWAVTLPEFPEILQRHVRARRRHRQGQCSVCGYPVTASPVARCPECGAAIEPPQPYRVSRRTVRLFVALNLAAWLIGCVAAESWILIDEHRFRAEAQAWLNRTEAASGGGNAAQFARSRAAPNGKAMLIYRPGIGFFAHE